MAESKIKKPKIGENGEYDSSEELYFSWYLDELKEAGYVKAWTKNNHATILTEPFKHDYKVPMKKVEDKKKQQIILRGSEYTHDFDVLFDKSAAGIFVASPGENEDKITTPFISTSSLIRMVGVEIKGGFDQNNMTRLVSTLIKFLYKTTGIYVNLVKVPDIFKNTFTPKRYLFTDKSKVPRKINFKVRSLQEYTKSINN